MIGCLRTRVRKQPIIALYFESENELKFYNLEAWVYKKKIITALVCKKSRITALVCKNKIIRILEYKKKQFPGLYEKRIGTLACKKKNIIDTGVQEEKNRSLARPPQGGLCSLDP